jgi:hypothetical protein
MAATEQLPTVRSHDAPLRPSGDRWLVQGVFFAGFWAYVGFLIRPRLIYDAFGIYLPYPEFSLDWACLREALSRVAGPLEYVSAYLSQWFSASPCGALIVTAAAGLICAGTERLLRNMGAMHGWFLSLFPALAVLIVYQTYHHPLAALLALAICLWLAVAYQAMAAPRRTALTPVAFLGMCCGLYYLAGAVCLLFGLLVGTWYACAKRRVIAGAGAILVSALVPWFAGTQWFHLTVVEAYSVAWPFGLGSASDMEAGPLNVLRGVFLFPIGMLWAVALCHGLPRAWQVRLPEFSRFGGRTLRVLSELAVLAAAVAAVHQFLRVPHREPRFEMVHFARQQQWEQVLHAARQLPGSSHDCFSRHLVNRALYHTGRLGDDQFSFSQDRAGLLLLSGDVPHGAPKFWMLSEIAWELGDLNLAEQWAFERIEAVGECPSALELLALICLAKDRSDGQSSGREAARVLLNRMTKNVVQGRRANTLLALLDGPPSAGDQWLQQIEKVRALRCTDDRVFQTYSEEMMLEGLLQSNPRNKMAFEYLMAFHLVSRRTDKLVENLRRLDDFGYRAIPRHYEEAILIHANETSQPVALPGRAIRSETVRRFHRFVDCVRPWQDQPHLALGALADEFGDSYFYYYAFGLSGTAGSRRGPSSQGPFAGVSGDGGSGTGGAR